MKTESQKLFLIELMGADGAYPLCVVTVHDTDHHGDHDIVGDIVSEVTIRLRDANQKYREFSNTLIQLSGDAYICHIEQHRFQKIELYNGIQWNFFDFYPFHYENVVAIPIPYFIIESNHSG